MTKHTPGPWRIEESGIRLHPVSGERARDFVLVAPDNSLPNIGAVYGRLDGENKANARLIASAPTLFSFVQSLALAGNTKAKETLDLLGLLD